MRDDARRLGAQQLGGVGVLLLRHDRRARRPRVGAARRSRTPRSTTARARRRAATGASRRSPRRRGSRATKSRLETASIEFGDDAGEAQLARRPSSRSVSKFTPASAPAPSGSSAAGVDTAAKRARSRSEHPDVGEQVVAEVDGLRALKVRVARHRPVEVRSARASSDLDQRAERRARAGGGARTNSAMSVATWSLRERAVCSLPADRARRSRSARRSIAMWMSSSPARERKRAVAQLALDGVEPAQQRVAIRVADDPRSPRASARARATGRCRAGHSRRSNASERVERLEVGVPGLARSATCAGQSTARRPSAAASAPRDALDLALAQLREERQRERARGDVLADRELALAVAEASRGRSSSGGSPAGRACSGCRARAARAIVASRSMPRGSCTTKTNQPRTVAAGVGARAARGPRCPRAPRGSARRRARAPASRSSRRSSCARPSAQAISDRR